MEQPCDPKLEQARVTISTQIRELFQIEDTSGVELLGAVHRAANLLDALENRQFNDLELSGPRWRLMLRLFIGERLGESGGLTPSALSRFQQVSKNTISVLLRGLEEQGLIQRELDAADLRVFRIQLTPAGRALIAESAPRRLAGLNHLLADLSREEREQLVALLSKLCQILAKKVHTTEPRNLKQDEQDKAG